MTELRRPQRRRKDMYDRSQYPAANEITPTAKNSIAFPMVPRSVWNA
jgi:hypothetical protein